MSCAPLHLNSLLEKMLSLDKDFRFMATNDLMSELQRDSIKLDDEMERKVVKMLLKLLEDKNGEVQNLAIKCLGALVNKVDIAQLETVVDNLCNNMQSDKEPLRDISSIGLKTVISMMPHNQSAPNICKRITNQLMASISKQEDVSVQLDTLDILADLLDRFGNLLSGFHQNIEQVLLQQLTSPRLAVRKRAVVAISQLSTSCSDAIFHDLISFLLVELEKNASPSTTKTYIQCLGAITRESGHRLGEHLDRVIGLVMGYCRVDKGSTSEEEDDELKECCVQSLESFIRRCPKHVSPHLESIINICLTFLLHDPNYSYDAIDENDDDDDAKMDIIATDDDDDDAESDDFTDDDDVSWKVRRAAAKCLAAIISTRHDLLHDYYKVVSPVLISRFKEREENVKADIFSTYIILLRRTRSTLATKDPSQIQDGCLALLANQIPNIVKSVHRLLKEKSLKTRQNCFLLLSELVLALPGALNNHIHLIIAGFKASLADKATSATMKIEALSFAHLLLTTHPPSVFQPHLASLCLPLVVCIADPFYKISSEALLVAQQLVKVIRPLTDTTPSTPSEANIEHLRAIFDATLARLQAPDVDHEVKERAISCSAQSVCNAGDLLGGDRLATYLPFLVERLANETTRQAAAKAIASIASSPLKVPFPTPLLNMSLSQLKLFLGRTVRELRLCGLHCLDCLLKAGYSLDFEQQDTFLSIVSSCTSLINDGDLYVAQMALQLLTTLCSAGLTSVVEADSNTLVQLVELTKSPLLQGTALQAVVDLLVALQGNNDDTTRLVGLLMKPVYESSGHQQNPPSPTITSLHKQAYSSLARCIAALVSQQHAREGDSSIEVILNNFLTATTNPSTPVPVKQLVILSLGEIGRKVQLNSKHLQLQEALIGCFASTNNNIKQASAIAIGAIAVGNMDAMLPFILKEIEAHCTKRQYLLLHSLKEVITCQQSSSDDKALVAKQLAPYVSRVWDILMTNCECQEEGTRNVVAECLGRLALLDRQALIPRLRECLNQDSPLTRSTVITAIKFVVTDQPQDELLKTSIGEFLSCLVDPDIRVRRVALVAFNSIAHNKPSLIKDLLPDILPQLYSETKVKSDLIREVEMGPFKHTIDDGLDIRKAAFECMYTLLDACLDKLDVFEFLSHVEEGLNDHYDIKMLTYLMLTRLSYLCPGAVYHRLERILEPLKTTCMSKVRSTSVEQEFDKQDELKRSALRAVMSLSALPDADKCACLVDFLNQVKQNQYLTFLLDSIKETYPTSTPSSNSPWTPSTHPPNKPPHPCLMDLS